MGTTKSLPFSHRISHITKKSMNMRHWPDYNDKDPDEVLQELCRFAWTRRNEPPDSPLRERVAAELKVIGELGYARMFLFLYSISVIQAIARYVVCAAWTCLAAWFVKWTVASHPARGLQRLIYRKLCTLPQKILLCRRPLLGLLADHTPSKLSHIYHHKPSCGSWSSQFGHSKFHRILRTSNSRLHCGHLTVIFFILLLSLAF
jgi:hypothetical protein